TGTRRSRAVAANPSQHCRAGRSSVAPCQYGDHDPRCHRCPGSGRSIRSQPFHSSPQGGAMSGQPITATSGGSPTSLAATPEGRARVTIVASALTLGSAAVAAVLLWHPGPPRNDFSYTALAPVRDATWLGMLIDSIGLSAAAIGLSISVCLLTPARGAVVANVGAVLATLGGAVFA